MNSHILFQYDLIHLSVFSQIPKPSIKPQSILKIQIGQRKVSEYQEGVPPFGLDDGLALTVVDFSV